MTGGAGRTQLHAFYAKFFLPQLPPDITIVPVSRHHRRDRPHRWRPGLVGNSWELA
jgi:carboxymethylenebutenolidase